VLPLRIQTDSFAYRGDLEVLEQYYSELWRAYVFISPRLFEDSAKCNAVVDAFCDRFGIPTEVAYRKVRMHDFATTQGSVLESGFETVNEFIRNLPIEGIPSETIANFLHEIGQDREFATLLSSGADLSQRLSALFQVSTLRVVLASSGKFKPIKKADVGRIERYCNSLLSGDRPYQVAAREGRSDYGAFVENLIEGVLSGRTGPSLVQ